MSLTLDAPRTKALGALVIVFAVAAAVFALALLAIPPAVDKAQWSYPLSTGPFIAGQVFIGLHHLVLAIGLLIAWRIGLAGRSRLAAVGGVGAFAVMLAFAVLEVVAAGAAGDSGPTEFVALLGGWYGALTALLAIASIIFGIAIVRARVWTGATRLTVLVTGIYLIVPMIPAQFDPLFWGRIALAIWSLLYVGLGIGLRRGVEA